MWSLFLLLLLRLWRFRGVQSHTSTHKLNPKPSHTYAYFSRSIQEALSFIFVFVGSGGCSPTQVPIHSTLSLATHTLTSVGRYVEPFPSPSSSSVAVQGGAVPHKYRYEATLWGTADESAPTQVLSFLLPETSLLGHM